MEKRHKSAKLWSERIQAAAKAVGIESYIKLQQVLEQEGLSIADNTAWRWWNGHRRPSKQDQYVTLDKVLKMEHSESIFFFAR